MKLSAGQKKAAIMTATGVLAIALYNHLVEGLIAKAKTWYQVQTGRR